MDFGQAVKWYRKSAQQGNGMALNNLGVMYHRGEGISMDFVLAHKWYTLAATFGIEQSARNRNDIATRMTPAQIQEALKLSKEWYAAYHRRQRSR